MKNNNFWKWFLQNEETLYNQLDDNPEEISTQIYEQLSEVHPDLVFDIPFEKVDTRYEFIISADGDASLFPLVFDFVSDAPVLRFWTVIALRPRTDQADQAIDLDGLYMEYEDIYYKIVNDTFPWELEIYIRNFEKEDNRYVHGYFLLLDTLLGEYNAVSYTQTISVSEYDEQDDVKRFVYLRDEFDAKKKNNLS